MSLLWIDPVHVIHCPVAPAQVRRVEAADQLNDSFHPHYTVDVLLLGEDGQPDNFTPLYRATPLPKIAPSEQLQRQQAEVFEHTDAVGNQTHTTDRNQYDEAHTLMTTWTSSASVVSCGWTALYEEVGGCRH